MLYFVIKLHRKIKDIKQYFVIKLRLANKVHFFEHNRLSAHKSLVKMSLIEYKSLNILHRSSFM